MEEIGKELLVDQDKTQAVIEATRAYSENITITFDIGGKQIGVNHF